MGSYWAKYILFDLKKYRRVTFYKTEKGYKIFGGIDFSFQNWHKEFEKFWAEHSKVSNISTFPSRKCISFKFKVELCFTTIKNDTKFEEELTCRFKIDILIGSLWPKYILLELQKYRGVIFHDTEEICKFWRKTDLWFEKRLEKFGKFSPEHFVKIGTLMGSFCPK